MIEGVTQDESRDDIENAKDIGAKFEEGTPEPSEESALPVMCTEIQNINVIRVNDADILPNKTTIQDSENDLASSGLATVMTHVKPSDVKTSGDDVINIVESPSLLSSQPQRPPPPSKLTHPRRRDTKESGDVTYSLTTRSPLLPARPPPPSPSSLSRSSSIPPSRPPPPSKMASLASRSSSVPASWSNNGRDGARDGASPSSSPPPCSPPPLPPSPVLTYVGQAHSTPISSTAKLHTIPKPPPLSPKPPPRPPKPSTQSPAIADVTMQSQEEASVQAIDGADVSESATPSPFRPPPPTSLLSKLPPKHPVESRSLPSEFNAFHVEATIDWSWPTL